MIVFVAMMFITTSWFLGQSGRGESVEWDESVTESLGSNGPANIAPRIIIRGKQIDGGCDYFLRLGITPDGFFTRARTVREDPDTCEKVVEVWTEPGEPEQPR